MTLNAAPTEIEAKFIVPGLEAVRERLSGLAATQVKPRVREINFRFDRPDGELRSLGHVLRLRLGPGAWLTFKAPGPDPEHRTEIEIGLDDPDRARQLLEALGFEVMFVYEKDREVFRLDDALVMLDDLPFGSFVEVESDDLGAVRRAAERLGLRWEDRVALTYLGLFESLRSRRRWAARNATFEEFIGVEAPPVEDLREAARSL